MLLSHPLYLAPIPVYAHLYASSGMQIDTDAPFVKQTFRNRAVIATENGTQTLTIPVVHTGRQAMKDVRISEHGNWRHLHWNALASAYRKSPFFDYYADDFAHFYEERDNFLMDFNLRLHAVISELLGLDRSLAEWEKEPMETEESQLTDIRMLAEPKVLETDTSTAICPYYQVFARRNGFIPNLSIVDLLFNMGPEGLIILKNSMKKA